MISTEVYTIPFGGKYVVYAPLRKIAFITNEAGVNVLAGFTEFASGELPPGREEYLQFLKAIEILGQNGDHEVFSPSQNPLQFDHVTLFLTNRCNLRCIYCYASGGREEHPVDMGLPIAKRGIEIACRNAVEMEKRSFSVGYHGGGEPTLNWDVLVQAVSYSKDLAERYGLEVRSTLASNGVFSEDHCKWIMRNLQGVSLSFDGLPEVHDRLRPMRSGGSSSRILRRTIESFEKASFPYSIRQTVTSDSVATLAKGVEYLLEFSRPKRILVEPVYKLGLGQGDDLQVKPGDFIAAFRDARSVAKRCGMALNFSNCRIDLLTDRFCAACVESVCFTPKGNISACYEVFDESVAFSEHFFIGSYDWGKDSIDLNCEKLHRIQAWNVKNLPWCEGCFAKWHCGGDCPNLVRHAMKEGEFFGHSRCEITRELLLDEILEKIHESGGLFWNGGKKGTAAANQEPT